MNLTKHEQLDLVRRIEERADNLAHYLEGGAPSYMVNEVYLMRKTLEILKNSFYDKNTYIKLVDRETGEVVMKYFEKGDVSALCYKASQYYAWADCDDTYRIDEIMCDGRELEYVGWQPGMLFEFESEDGGIVYSAKFPEWDH